MKKKNQKTALFSVAPHKEIEDFAKELIKAGWKIIATKDACEYLKSKDIEATNVSDFVGVKEDYGFPPTLHPKMEAALTTDCKERIDIVYDIPYGMDVGNDVGGRTLLALAAKGDRIPVMTKEDMHAVVLQISKKGKIEEKFAEQLRAKANFEISNHYFNLTTYPSFAGLLGEKHFELMNGENIYQVPAFLFKTPTKDSLSIHNFKQVAGNKPCFTNTADLDCILETLCKIQNALILNGFSKSYVAIASKHGNPCGAGVSLDNPEESIKKALWGNAKGIWGGEVITNFPIDEKLSYLLKRSEKREKMLGIAGWMLDVIAAPDMSSSAVKKLSSNPNRKLFVNPALSSPYLRKEKHLLRQVRGGFLSQPPFDYILDLKKVDWTNKAKEEDKISLIIAWAVAFTSYHGGNEVALAKNNSLLSAGGGPSTYDAANTAVSRAKEQGHDTQNSSFGADAFFPFTDVPEILSKAGCTSGTVPSGGKREKDVIDYFKKNNITVGFIPEQYRGFCRH